MHTHFRPRPVDVNHPLPIITDAKEVEKIEQDAAQHSYTPIKSKRKRKSEELEEEQEPIATVDNNKVPIPSIREVPDEANKNKKNQYKHPTKYLKYKEKTEEQLMNTIEYDLDSEDEDFLTGWKAREAKPKKKKEPLTEDQFESIIDLFEKKSSQKRMPSDELEFFQTYFHLPEGVPCCICGEHEASDDNPIVFCDDCNIAVHQYCYGINKAPNPEASWQCRKCEKKAGNVKCIFCPIETGAFKHTTDGRWSHVVCALWIPELSFKDKESMEPITRISKIPSTKWNQPCVVCNKSYGVCVECSEKDCPEKFHVLCGREVGFILATQQTKNTDLRFVSYCRKHSMKRELEKETPTFGFKRLSSSQILKLSSIIESERKITLPSETIESLFHFWQLKRKHHPRSLLRRLQYLERGVKFVARNNITDDEYHSRFINLRRDFEKVRLLLDLLRKRENLKRDHMKTLEELIVTSLHERRKQGPRKDLVKKTPIVVEDEEDDEIIEDKSEDEVEEDVVITKPQMNGKHSNNTSSSSSKKVGNGRRKSKSPSRKTSSNSSNNSKSKKSKPNEKKSKKEVESEDEESDKEEEEEEAESSDSNKSDKEDEESDKEEEEEEEEEKPPPKKTASPKHKSTKKASRSPPPSKHKSKANGKSPTTNSKKRKES